MEKKTQGKQQTKTQPKNQSKQKQVIQHKPQKINWMIAVCCVVTFIVYTPVFKAGFVSWDDPDYVTDNRLIRSFDNFNQLITKPLQGNYHPLTMLSLAFNYAISGKNAGSYHFLNLLLHLLNIVLVFLFVYRLTGRKPWIAFITALLFAIHPLHVESVAWVSERKDVMYTFFFMAGLIVYLKYLEKKSWLTLAVVFMLFTLSILSKPAAIIFPIVLLAVDFYFSRLKSAAAWIEKIPFLALSLIFALLTLHGQTTQGAVAGASIFPVHFRIFFGFYGIMMYLVKAVVPVSLCTFYPFPPLNNPLTIEYLMSPLVTIGLAIAFFLTYKKNKLIAFGILFYLINLALVLQFLPVGSAIIADRYTYVPLIGAFLVPGYYFQSMADKNAGKPNSAFTAIIVIIAFIFSILAYKQVLTWKDSATLWEKAISVAPSSRAYSNRGLIYKQAGQNDKAIEMYSKAISMNKVEMDALINRGNIYFNQKKYDLAIEDYNKCLEIDPKKQLAIENRGAAYAALGNNEMALKDMNLALQLQPNSVNGFANRAVLYQNMRQPQAAIDDFYRHLKNTPDETGDIWNSIGVSELELGHYQNALDCFNKSMSLGKNPTFLANRAIARFSLGDKAGARADVQQAVKQGANVNPAFLEKLK